MTIAENDARRRGTVIRRSAGVLVVLALLALAVVLPRSWPSPTVSPTPTADASAATGADADDDGEADDPATSTVTVPAPRPAEQRLPTDGPGVAEPGVLLVVSPTTDGALTVTESVRWPQVVDEARLSPPDLGDAGSHFDDVRPRATTVQADADGRLVPVPDGTVADPVTVSPGADLMTLSYRLEGSTVRTVPSTAGRALAAVTPLTSDLEDLPVRLVVTGEDVSTITCPLLPDAEQVCGTGTPVREAGPVPAAEAMFVLQVDLP